MMMSSETSKHLHPRHQRSTGLRHFLFGAPYYPEHWSEEDRELDPHRMKAAGVNTIRMAEFAWDVMEPAREQFDFSLFDQTIAEMGEHGIDTILCTPTATPPRWLTAGKPEWMRVTADGVRMEHGNRQHVCTNNPDFRAESRRVTRAMAEHFCEQDHVIGWQTDNEFYCHFAVCYCESCVAEFQTWAEKKYKAIDALNEAWGTRFWAQTYDSFSQIPLPRPGLYPAPGNPSHELDHARFLSDSITDFQHEQVQILREVQPRWWITHNGTFGSIDHWKFAEDLEFYGVDVYPGFNYDNPEDYTWAALKNESCRQASGSYIVPEQSGGPGGQLDYMHRTSEPGQMRLWAYQSIAHGADGILHFRWRTCRFGAEIYWNGILDHDNKLRRRYHEFGQEGQELRRIGDAILGTTKEVKLAILTSYDDDRAYDTQSNGFAGPHEQTRALYREAARRHLPVGIVNAKDTFDGLDVIVMPSLVIEDKELTQKLEAFVADGGLLLVTARSFTRDANNHVQPVTAPASLANLLGITREEEGRILDSDDTFLLSLDNHKTIQASAGYEILALGDAESLANWRIDTDPERARHQAEGNCGISSNHVGSGKAIYFGSYLSEDNVSAILDLLQKQKTIQPLVEAPPSLEATIRRSEENALLFLLNHSARKQLVTHIPSGEDLLTQTSVSGTLELDPFGVCIIEMQPSR